MNMMVDKCQFLRCECVALRLHIRAHSKLKQKQKAAACTLKLTKRKFNMTFIYFIIQTKNETKHTNKKKVTHKCPHAQ